MQTIYSTCSTHSPSHTCVSACAHAHFAGMQACRHEGCAGTKGTKGAHARADTTIFSGDAGACRSPHPAATSPAAASSACALARPFASSISSHVNQCSLKLAGVLTIEHAAQAYLYTDSYTRQTGKRDNNWGLAQGIQRAIDLPRMGQMTQA